MDNCRKYLRLSSIINIMLGVVLPYTFYSTFLIVLGYLLLVLSSNDDEKLLENKTMIIVFSIISIPINLISTVFLILAHDSLTKYEKEVNGENAPPQIIKTVVDKDVKNIDILLKLGVGMVFLAGILFATTSWSFISNLAKVIALIVFGILFILLSLFSEKKLKIFNTTYLYWLLGISFLLLSIIAMLYFKVFGQYITYSGEGKYIAYIITCLSIFGLSLSTYLKFSKDYILHIVYTSLLLIITYILKLLSLDNSLIIIFITTILFTINLMSPKESTLSNFSKIISYTMFGFVLKSISNSNEILILLSSLVIIVNNLLLLNENNKEENIIILIITYILLIPSIYNINGIEINAHVILFIVFTIHALIAKFNIIRSDKIYNTINYIFYVILTIVLTLFVNYDKSIYTFIIQITFLITNIFLYMDTEKSIKMKYTLYLIPFIIFGTISSIYVFDFYKFKDSNIIVICTIIYTLLHIIIKDEKIKKVFLISTISSILLAFLTELVDTDKISSIPILLSSIYIFIISRNNTNKVLKAASYILLLSSVYNMITIVDILGIKPIYDSLLFTLVLIGFIILEKDNVNKKITILAFIIPIYDLIEYLDFNYVYELIASSIMILYITFLIVKYLCKDDFARNLLSIIGIVMAVFRVIEGGYIAGIYIGIIGILVLILGIYKKELKGLFPTGLIITIVNILYQLKDVWDKIPFWLYLLLSGLSIIGFVTYKEISKQKK